MVEDYDEQQRDQSTNFLFLTPGNTLVFLNGEKVRSSPFPRGNPSSLQLCLMLYSEEVVNVSESSTIELINTNWNMLCPQLKKSPSYRNCLSENVILAFNKATCSLSVWLVKVPLHVEETKLNNYNKANSFSLSGHFLMEGSNEGCWDNFHGFSITKTGNETNSLTTQLMQWKALLQGSRTNFGVASEYKICVCDEVKSRALKSSKGSDKEQLETRAMFAVLLQNQMLVFCLKRELCFHPPRMECTSEWKCVLLHRLHYRLDSSRGIRRYLVLSCHFVFSCFVVLSCIGIRKR